MRKNDQILLLLAVITCVVNNAIAATETITCPSPSELHAYEPERTGKNSVRFWFGGKRFKWTPMALKVKIAVPFSQTRSRPVLQANKISLVEDKSGDWIIECTYEESTKRYKAQNKPISRLTIHAHEAKSCTLNRSEGSVSCEL